MEQLLDTSLVHVGKPRIEPGQVLALNIDRQAEKIALVKATTVRRPAAATPFIAIDGVQRVIHQNFFPGGQIAFCNQKSLMMSGVDVAIRVAGMIDVALRGSHEDYGSIREEVAVTVQFSLLELVWMFRVDDP